MFKQLFLAALAVFFVVGTASAYDPVPPAHEKKVYKDPETGNVFMHRTTGYLNLSTENTNGEQNIPISGGKDNQKLQLLEGGEYEVILLKKEETTRKRRGKVQKKTIRKEISRYSVFIDVTNPKSFLDYDQSYVVNGKSPIFGQPVAITLQGNDKGEDKQSGVDDFYYSLNSSEYQKYTEPLRLEEEGSYDLRYYAVDRVGNTEKPNRIKIIIDRTAPSSTLVFDRFSNENKFFSPLSKIRIRSSDEGAGTKNIYYKINQGAFKKYTGRIKLDNLNSGTSTISYYSEDRVGNREIERVYEITLDKANPSVTLMPIGPHFEDGQAMYIRPDTRFEITSEDDLSGVRESYFNFNNETNWSVYYEPFTVKDNLKRQKINYWTSDNVSNKTKTGSINVIIDNDLPSASLKINSDHFKQDNLYYVHPTTKIDLITFDPSSGIKTFAYSLDNKEFVTDKPITISDDGQHSLRIRVIDNVDLENTVQFSVIVDSGLPSVDFNFDVPSVDQVQSGQQQINVYPKKSTVFISAADKLSGISAVYYSLDGEAPQVYDKPIQMQTEGEHKLEIYARDRVGNRSPTSKVTFQIK